MGCAILLAFHIIIFQKANQTGLRKWNNIYATSTESDTLHDAVNVVGKFQASIRDRKIKTIMNQFINCYLGLKYLTLEATEQNRVHTYIRIYGLLVTKIKQKKP